MNDKPAFPQPYELMKQLSEQHGDASPVVGLSRRELFAAMAMAHMAGSRDPNGDVYAYVEIAEFAVGHADALITELDKSHE